MPAPAPPVALTNACSVIYNNTLYVYSPAAFLSLPLQKGGNWTTEQNGVSVTGARCVLGGTDGVLTDTSLYIVGGTPNTTTSTYSGLQRYSFGNKTWSTISPVVAVTQRRLNHGAAYLNSSNCIVMYAGSQNGASGPSSETFLIEMYPPYRVQAYSSTAPPATDPQMMQWSNERALMVGGTTPNDEIYTFGAADGWKNLNLTFPTPLPDPSVAQSALLMLDDGSKVLQTFRMDQTPPLVTNYVLLNPGGLPASVGQTVGGTPAGSNSTDSANTTTSSNSTNSTPKYKRQEFLQIFPQYNSTGAPTASRTDFTIAQNSNGLLALVGGNNDDPLVFFNQFGDGWVSPNAIFGTPLPTTTSTMSTRTSTSSTSTATSSRTSTSASSTATATPGTSTSSSNHGLILLGAVLGSICVVAAILIIFFLWLRSMRRKKAKALQKGAKRRSDYPTDKHSFEDQGLQPLSKAGQPMGVSAIPITAIIHEEDHRATGTKTPEKGHIRKISGEPTGRVMSPANAGGMGPGNGGFGMGQGLFKRDKGPLVISKPMQPNLGDYQERPAIELGKATPTLPDLNLRPTPNRQASNRKTDEGWGKYFQAENIEEKPALNRISTTSTSPSASPHAGQVPAPFAASRSSAPSPASRGTSSFWPNTATYGPPRNTQKLPMRDSAGNALNTQTVAGGSPSLAGGPSGRRSRDMAAARGTAARISTASSVNTMTSGYTEEDYEDDKIEPAYASGGSYGHGQGQMWPPTGPVAPVAQNWGMPPPPRPVRRPSMIGPGPSLSTLDEEDHSPGDVRNSIPTFPMPSSTIRHVQPSGGSDINGLRHGMGQGLGHGFGHAHTQSGPHWIVASRKFSEAPVRRESSARHSRDEMAANSDVSWLQLRDKKD